MPLTRRHTTAKQDTMAQRRKELAEEHAAQAAVSKDVMARYFKEADEHAEIRANRLEKQIDKMNSILAWHTEEIRAIRSETANLRERITNAEKSTAGCQRDLQTFQTKLIELEDRARRDNLQIFNLKKGTEGPNALTLLMDSIPKWFTSLESAPPELMRCHRLGRLPGVPVGKQQRSRPMIVKFLRFTDRDRVLNEARKSPPSVDGIQLKFAADYSESTTKRRQLCYKLMHEARVKGFQAFLLYPATIKLSRGSEVHTFQDPKEAEDFILSLDKV